MLLFSPSIARKGFPPPCKLHFIILFREKKAFSFTISEIYAIIYEKRPVRKNFSTLFGIFPRFFRRRAPQGGNMPQDAFHIRRSAAELDAALKGGKINRVSQADKDEVTLIIYTGKSTVKLVLSTNASNARVCLSATEKEPAPVAPNFCMLCANTSSARKFYPSPNTNSSASWKSASAAREISPAASGCSSAKSWASTPISC